MDNNYKHFDNNDENKLIYTTLHREYVSLVENYLQEQLTKRIPGFSMTQFMKELM
jgi:ADP-ribosylation factor-like protein 2-binding protein